MGTRSKKRTRTSSSPEPSRKATRSSEQLSRWPVVRGQAACPKTRAKRLAPTMRPNLCRGDGPFPLHKHPQIAVGFEVRSAAIRREPANDLVLRAPRTALEPDAAHDTVQGVIAPRLSAGGPLRRGLIQLRRLRWRWRIRFGWTATAGAMRKVLTSHAVIVPVESVRIAG